MDPVAATIITIRVTGLQDAHANDAAELLKLSTLSEKKLV